MFLGVCIPVVVACTATPWGMNCWRQPLSRAVLIPREAISRQQRRRVLVSTTFIMVVVVWSTQFSFTRSLHGLDLSGRGVAAAYIGTFLVLGPLAVILPSSSLMTPGRAVLVAGVFTLVVWIWLHYPVWIMYDLVAALIVCNLVVLMQSRMPYKWLTRVLVVAACLDAAMIYGATKNSGAGISSMLQHIEPPLFFLMPTQFSLQPTTFAATGFGDVHVVGLLALTAFRLGITKVGNLRPFFVSLLASCVALVMCDMAAILFHHSQPALVFIVPVTCGAVYADAWRKGYLGALRVPLYQSRKQQAALAACA